MRGCWWLIQVPERTMAPINEEYEIWATLCLHFVKDLHFCCYSFVLQKTDSLQGLTQYREVRVGKSQHASLWIHQKKEEWFMSYFSYHSSLPFQWKGGKGRANKQTTKSGQKKKRMYNNPNLKGHLASKEMSSPWASNCMLTLHLSTTVQYTWPQPLAVWTLICPGSH